METINLKLKTLTHFHALKGKLPSYMTAHASGIDLCACISEKIALLPLDRVIVPTGLAVELPVGFEGQVRPRSGLAFHNGITVLNGPGTIDADYRGEIKIILINFGKDTFMISHGDRIAQLVISKVVHAHIVPVTELETTERDIQGFGHTGVSL